MFRLNFFKFFLACLIIISPDVFGQPLLPKISNNLNSTAKTFSPSKLNKIQPISEAYSKEEIVIKINNNYLTNCGKTTLDIADIKSILSNYPIKSIEAKYPHENKRFFPQHAPKFSNNPLEGIYSIKFKGDVNIESIISQLSALPQIVYAEHIKIYGKLNVPNDPLADSLLTDSILNGSIGYFYAKKNQYYLGSVSAYQAWNITKGDSSVLIGIIDTGFDTSFTTEFVKNIAFNTADTIDGIDNDGNGYVDDYWGWNTANSNGYINVAQNGNTCHGMRVAGVAGARANNGIGIAGLGYNCKIVPVKTWNGYGLQSTYDGIYYCVKRGCKVINCSWGGPGTFLQSEQDVINYATANGAVVVAAAGNGTGQFYQTTPFYPASYNNVLSVAQCLPDGTNFLAGPINAVTYNNYVSLVAPGISIYSLYFGDYGEDTGSSLASPIVAGAAGLVWTRYPNYTPRQIIERIRVSTDYKDSLPQNKSLKEMMGSGMLNVYRAVTDNNLEAARWDGDSILNSFLGNTGYAFAGDTMMLAGNIVNYLHPTSNLKITVSTSSTYLIVVDSVSNYGSLGTLKSAWNTNDPFKVYVLPGSPNNFSATFRIGFSDGNYSDYQYITVNNINPPKVYPTYQDININQITLSVANSGRFAFDDKDAYQVPSVGDGYTYIQPYQRAREMGFLTATSSNKVSDCIRGQLNSANQMLKDSNFTIVNPLMYSSGPGDQNLTVSYTDAAAPNPIGISIFQKTYAWKNAPNNEYVIIEYTIENISGSPIDSLCAGVFTDYLYYAVPYREQWVPSINSGVTYATYGITYYNGIELLYPSQKPAHYAFNYNQSASGINIGDGFTEAEKFKFMSNGILNQSAGLSGQGTYLANYVGTTLYNLLPNTKRTVAFAIINGTTTSDLINTANQSINKFKSIKSGPKPIIDSVFTICKGNSQIFAPLEFNSMYNIYDTLPGVRSAIAQNVHFYTISGITKTKTYYITNSDSIFESTPQKVTVNVDPIHSSFSYTLSTITPRTVSITSTSPGNTWTWNLADGSTAVGNSFTHTYSNSGGFPVTLILTDAIGCKDTSTQIVTIPPYTPAPKPIIDSLIIVCKGQNYVLQPTGGSLFNFYDTIPGTAPALLSKVPTFTTSGITSSVTYYITDADSLFEGPWAKVIVSYSIVNASFTYAISQDVPLTVDFSSTTPGTSFLWHLGNRNTATGANFSYTYDSTGTYIVRLTIKDNFGCSDSIQQSVLVPAITDISNNLITENIKILPNPANDFIIIQTKGFNGFRIDGKLINPIGQIVYVDKIQLSDQSPVSIPVSSFASGVYTLILQDGASSIVKKISIVR